MNTLTRADVPRGPFIIERELKRGRFCFLYCTGLPGRPIGWAAEYPSAHLFKNWYAVKAMASVHPGARVWRASDYVVADGKPLMDVPK